AAQQGHKEIVELLLQTGKVDLETKDNDRERSLFCAASEGHTKVVELLLQIGKVDPDTRNNNGETPLYIAAKKGYTEVIKVLLQTGKVDTNIPSYYPHLLSHMGHGIYGDYYWTIPMDINS
ncbi:hypothetical protein M422DRAFT_170838, partial [Sphaerobolus stellatus SS14]